MEYLTIRCRPFYLPRELQCTILCIVHTSPQLTRMKHCKSSNSIDSECENTYPNAGSIVLDCNQCNLKSISPKYEQYITFPYSGNNTLHQCYSNIKKAYTAVPKSNFDISDYIAILLQPLHTKKLKAELVTVRTEQKK